MKYWVVSLFLLMVISSSVYAKPLTCKAWDGYPKTDDATPVVKLNYVMGVMDGMILSGGKTEDNDLFDKSFRQMSYGRIADALNSFCNDYRNSNVIMYLALRIIALEISGISKMEIEREKEKARKLGNDYFQHSKNRGSR